MLQVPPRLGSVWEPIVTALDRLSDGYQPDFDIDIEWGKQGELFVTDLLAAIKTGSIEVKNDAKFERTGNVFVEYRCQRRDGWQPSGIATTKAEFWAFVLHNNVTAVFVRTDKLKGAVRHLYRKNVNRRPGGQLGSHPTEGVLVSVAWLMQSGTRLSGANG
jgi:hypothetical protein